MRDETARSVGALLAVGLPGPTLDDATRADLTELQPGCVVLFRRNVVDPQQLRTLTTDLHALDSVPLIAVDQEGGRVARLRDPFTRMPPAARIGTTGDPALAYRAGRALAAELRCVGIDIDFAPVLDIHSNPKNDVIGDRAFGRDPETVARMALALQRGLADGGVIACGKHFPGHGDTNEDSHFALPTVHRSRAEMEAREWAPFRSAIAAGVPMLMTAHIICTTLDPERPATLSPAVIRGILREQLGFTGVVATDDMDMRAVADHYPAGEAAVLAVAAGCDLVLVCQSLATARLARDALADAVRSGRLARLEIEAALGRLARLRAIRPAPLRGACPLPNREHRALVAEIEARNPVSS